MKEIVSVAGLVFILLAVSLSFYVTGIQSDDLITTAVVAVGPSINETPMDINPTEPEDTALITGSHIAVS